MIDTRFPKFNPPAVDATTLKPPTVVNKRNVQPTIIFPQGGGRTQFLLTQESAGCKYIHMGLFLADPGRGSQWHTHPREAEEEEYLYIIEGRGTMFYKQGGKEHQIQFKAGEAIFTGHLTHYIRNTGTQPLEIYFAIAPLPARTIIYGVQNDQGQNHVDSVNLKPPQLILPEDIPITTFTHGGLTNRRLLHPENVGACHGRFGTALETPGTGSFWHTHPLEIGEEDLFYTIRGRGTMVYLQGGKVHSFEFRGGDAIHSHHLTNYTINHTGENLEMVYCGAPHPQGTIVHELA